MMICVNWYNANGTQCNVHQVVSKCCLKFKTNITQLSPRWLVQERWLVHPSCKTITITFVIEEGGSGATQIWALSIKEKLYLMPYSIQSQHLYCFCHLGCWNGRPFGPYFSSLLAIFQCSKTQGSCLIQMSNTHTPYGSSQFYGDVLHEGITCWLHFDFIIKRLL